MNREEERLTCRMIEGKMERGEPLTSKEQRVYAYSDYGSFNGYAGGCGAPLLDDVSAAFKVNLN